MKDPLHALDAFYAICDRAEPPTAISLSARLLSAMVGTMAGGLAPFMAAFSVAAAAIAMVGALAAREPTEGPTVFLKTLHSAGLTRVEAKPHGPKHESRMVVPVWRV
jgi:hypothetical protein